MFEEMRWQMPWKAAMRPLLGLLIYIALAPGIAFGGPIGGPGAAATTAQFTFTVPDPVPGKLAGGGWGALFLKFNRTIATASFTTTPALAACAATPTIFGVGTKEVSFGCETPSGAYLFNNQTHKDLTITVTVTTNEAGPVRVIFERNSPSDGTFWAQKRLRVTGGPASGQATNTNPQVPNPTLAGTLAPMLISNGSKGISVTCQMSNGTVDNAGECLQLLNRPDQPLTFAFPEPADETTPEPGLGLFFNGVSFKTPGGFLFLERDGSDEISDQISFGNRTLRFFSDPNENIDQAFPRQFDSVCTENVRGCTHPFSPETNEGELLRLSAFSDGDPLFGEPGGLGPSDTISVKVVPEPATWLLLVAGCVGLLALAACRT